MVFAVHDGAECLRDGADVVSLLEGGFRPLSALASETGG